MDDPYNLQRFVDAQEPVYDDVLSELGAGQKRTHWMWFIFPQIKGLGHSPMAVKYGISSLDEADAYLNHPILGRRLRQCTEVVNLLVGRSVDQIFGYPDNMKFHSSMTLFVRATADNGLFKDAITKYFNGNLDKATVDRL